MKKVMAGDWWQVAGRRCTHVTRHASLVTLFLLTACGFQPLHGVDSRATQAVDLPSLMISVSGTTAAALDTATVGARRYSELLEAEIESNINPRGERRAKQFHLAITYTQHESAQFVQPDGTASRGDVIYSSSYTITRLSDMKVITNGAIQRTSSFNSSPTADYASYVSIDDARRRGIIELAQDYKLRLAALMPMINDPNSPINKPPKKPLDPEKPELMPDPQPLRNYETYRTRY